MLWKFGIIKADSGVFWFQPRFESHIFLQKDGEKNVLRIVTYDSFQKTLGLNPTLQKKHMVTKTMEKVKTGLR